MRTVYLQISLPIRAFRTESFIDRYSVKEEVGIQLGLPKEFRCPNGFTSFYALPTNPIENAMKEVELQHAGKS